jgi:DeoR family transcriptional regulator, L-fucose operon activator
MLLVEERHQKIVELVNEKGSIRVTELARIFSVTEETIRRDLDKLESEKQLQRSHGGAVRIREAQPEIPYFERENVHVAEKEAIAAQAVKHIEPNDRIILDASTTAWYLAKNIPDIPLTVLTNSIKIALVLSAKERIEVISTGGILLKRSLSYVGPLAERSLDAHFVNKAFVSCKGVHLQYGLSESNEMQGLIKQKMITIADQVYCLADYSKLDVRSFTRVAHIDQVDFLITDSRANREFITKIKESSVVVLDK